MTERGRSRRRGPARAAPERKSRQAGGRRLDAYRRKRDFGTSPEPDAHARRSSREAAELRFVVHEHHARRLHWDLRLEHDGALASWAVPNGLPEDPKHNRKAIHVEDHPLEYIDFEGVIPRGSYGAGRVSVWDSGTYECEKWRANEVIAVFAGERLRGRYALFQAGREERDWLIHRMDPPADPTAQEMPERLKPMLARLSELPANEEEWGYEVKWDGVRAIARSEPGRLHLISRNGNDVTSAYPELRALGRALGSRRAMLDGEIIAFDSDGHPRFEALQPRMHQRGEAAVRRLMKTTPVTYVVFDLLWLDGHSLMELPYRERRARLQELELNGEHWRTPPYHSGPDEGEALLRATSEQGLEGVVAKRLDSRYLPGGRTGAWLKIKHHCRQEVVIGGWSGGKGARAGSIGALDAGVHDTRGALRYAGQVGTGFDEPELRRLAGLLAGLAREDSPFAGRQPPRGVRFVEPELVCEVEFSEWTKAGQLRQASYKGLRTDKPAAEVLRERVQTPRAGKQRSAQMPSGARAKAPSRARRKAGAGEAGPRSPARRTASEITFKGARRTRGGLEVDVERRTLKLTNLEKVMYPQTGFTKGDLIGYYAAIAPVLLAHLRDRPLTLKRYPDGVQGKHFYEKQCPGHRPDWVQTVAVRSERNDREIDYCTCRDLPTLVWLANLAAVELHPSLSRAQALERPSALAFDLDPGAPAGIVECCEVALLVRDLLGELGVEALAKTSGAKGLQVYLPLNDRGAAYEQTKPFARAVAELLEHRRPELVTATMTRSKRRGRVLIDWSQNDEHKTTVSVYSLRAVPSPSVSAPLSWEEVEACRHTRDPAPLKLGPGEVLERVRRRGDLFADVLTLRQRVPRLG